MKNKVEAQPRKVNKKNRVIEPIHDVDVKQLQLNVNSELICASCKKSMFNGCPNCSLVSGLQMFQTYGREPLSSHELFLVSAVPRAIHLANSPVSTLIDQDAPSTSIPLIQYQEHSLIISQCFEESPKTPHFHNDPLHEDSTSQGSSSNVRPIYTLFESLGRWTKDNPIANVIGCPNCSLVSGLQMFQTYDREPLSSHELSSKTKSWLWHHRLSHLNFGTLNKLAKDGLAQGLPRLKFQKDHMCSACALGKIKKSSHQPKAKDTNQEKLYLLHMDLCGPMHVASINGKRKRSESITKELGKIIETIHVTFDELSAMAYEQFSSGPELHSMTPATSSSGLVSNLISQQPCIPPNRYDWDRLFQPMFNKYFNPPTIVVSLVPVSAAPRAVHLANSPVSTLIDQDALSTSIPSIQYQEHSLIISQGFEESPKTPHFHNDPLHEDSTSQGSSSNVRPIYTLFESLGRWTKDNPIANVIGDPSHFVSTRKQLQTNAMWCYFDAFLTFLKPTNFKRATTKPSWIDEIQEEINEFERLQVWELVPCPDKVMLIKLKWIYKVKIEEFGRVLKNKARLVAHGFSVGYWKS
nr:integrase, catalytic region, zinc finger, CCHC-type, peptidase aspartic, catalytic [Tanacetum cinerariifolium]